MPEQSQLNYSRRGKGRPVVLVHGFPFDHTIWEAQLEGLSDGASILAPDLPGFGGSRPGLAEPDIEAYADAIAGWSKELRLGTIILAGHSMGGYVALALARRHPKLLAGLVLVSTRAGADSETGREGRRKMADEVMKRGPQATVDAMLPKLLGAVTRERDPGIVDRVRETMLRQSKEGIVAALQAMAARPDSTPTLAAIQAPSLVVAGTDDAVIPITEAEFMVSHIKDARYTQIPNAGHLPMMESPEEFNRALASFLRTLR